MAYRYSTDEIIDALRATNGLVSLAAKKLKCCPNTIYNRAHSVQGVQRVIDECRAELVDLGELSLRRAVVNGEPWAVGLVLKTLGKERGYVERTEHDMRGRDGGPLEIEYVNDWRTRGSE